MITLDKIITLDASGANKLDIFFLADNTGSMGGVIINNVKAQAAGILSTLQGTYSDINFGVGRYVGDPAEGSGENYLLQQAITSNDAAATAAINNWFASGDGDFPEGNFDALEHVASDAGTGWRAGTQRLVVYFGDAPSHTETTTEAQAIAALTAENIIAMPMNNGPDNNGLDGCYGSECNQADDIANGTGGISTNNTSGLSSADLAARIISVIGTISWSVDLDFLASYAGTGLGIDFTCTDALGCNDVAGGESRSFQVKIIGNTAGVYDFDVSARGVSTFEHDHIVVGDGSSVPEPGSLAIMSLGLGALAWSRRRKAI